MPIMKPAIARTLGGTGMAMILVSSADSCINIINPIIIDQRIYDYSCQYMPVRNPLDSMNDSCLLLVMVTTLGHYWLLSRSK